MNSLRSNTLLVACAVLVAVAGAVTIVDADPPSVPGHVIVARAEGDALVIWDATAEVTEIVKDKLDDDAAKDRLKRDALEEVTLEESKLSNLTSISVRVIYTKTGDVSPVYGSPTFAGVERYAVLKMSAADVKSDRGQWKEAVAGAGTVPSWAAFTILGSLPPR
jgi:hypothetical protein